MLLARCDPTDYPLKGRGDVRRRPSSNRMLVLGHELGPANGHRVLSWLRMKWKGGDRRMQRSLVFSQPTYGGPIRSMVLLVPCTRGSVAAPGHPVDVTDEHSLAGKDEVSSVDR
jgi:hypothetical protein